MAKGLRSKGKRANRALLRQQLTAPLVAKAQEELSKRLVTDLKKQQGNTAAIQKLKTLLAGKKKAKDSEIEHQQFAMDPEDKPTRGKAGEDKPVQQALVTVRKASFSFRDVLEKEPKPALRPKTRS